MDQQTDYAGILQQSRDAEAEALAEWTAEIVAEIQANGAQPIDWTGQEEGDLIGDAMGDAAETNLGLPYALVRMALREAGVLGDRRVTRALQEVAIRYTNGGYTSY